MHAGSGSSCVSAQTNAGEERRSEYNRCCQAFGGCSSRKAMTRILIVGSNISAL